MTNRYWYDPDKPTRLAAIAETDAQIETNEETFRTEDIGGGGGGGSAAGDTGQIQYNDAGGFAASPDLVWGPGMQLSLNATPNGTVSVKAGGVGGQIFLEGADGDDAHPGGEVTLAGGTSQGHAGGNIDITAGADSADGNGGNIAIISGHSADGDGGDINIRAHAAGPVGGRGGDINVRAGSGFIGGTVLVQAGNPAGSLQFYSANGNQFLELNNNGLFLPGVVDVSSLPTADPTSAGQLWNDAGTLKISAG